MKERLYLCKILVGSHLYGTSGPNSDMDYFGVFIPSRDDLFAMRPYPSEISADHKNSAGSRNQAGDVDCKFFSLAKFMKLAAEGQPGQLEMLFASPLFHAAPIHELWGLLVSRRNLFLGKNSILPFIGFAEAQAYKAVIKAENLEKIELIIHWSLAQDATLLRRSIAFHLLHCGGLGPCPVSSFKNEYGAELIEIAGRHFDVAMPLKRLVDALIVMEKKYGSRSRRALAEGVDWKSVHHAFRLTYEAEELMKTGSISLPFSGVVRDFLCEIKQGKLNQMDWSQLLTERIEYVKASTESASLPEHADMKAIEALHIEILERHIAREP